MTQSTENPPLGKLGRPLPRPEVLRMHAYIPGEQPKNPKLVKLNTNENSYPPSPRVLEALHALGDHAVGRYPDPMCTRLRESIAGSLGVEADQIIMGNGSDEVLKMAIEAYVDPEDSVGYLWPTYSLYPVFLDKIGAHEVRFPWSPDRDSQEYALAQAPEDLKLVFITNPNPPFGLEVTLEAIRRFAETRLSTLVVVDEAYIAYGGESAIALVREDYPNVIVTRSFSKSHSLAGMRAGFAVGPKSVIEMFYRVKDSYNLNAATQAATLASWEDASYTETIVAKICATRERVAVELTALGFNVPPSRGNFLFARHPEVPEIFAKLRENNVLVRYFDTPELRDGLRISIGTDQEMDVFLQVLKQIVLK